MVRIRSPELSALQLDRHIAKDTNGTARIASRSRSSSYRATSGCHRHKPTSSASRGRAPTTSSQTIHMEEHREGQMCGGKRGGTGVRRCGDTTIGKSRGRCPTSKMISAKALLVPHRNRRSSNEDADSQRAAASSPSGQTPASPPKNRETQGKGGKDTKTHLQIRVGECVTDLDAALRREGETLLHQVESLQCSVSVGN